MAGPKGIAGALKLAERAKGKRGGNERQADGYDRSAPDALGLWHDAYLEALTTRLAPCREVRLELKEAEPRERFTGFGAVEEHSDRTLRLLIPREQLTERVAQLLNRFDVLDLEVRDPPIEELIGALFREPDMARAPRVGPASTPSAPEPP